MHTIPRPQTTRQFGRPVWGTLASAGLVAVGLSLAFLAIDTPFVARLMPGSGGGSGQTTTATLVWFLSLAAGAALLVSGTSRLAVSVASFRRRRAGRSPVMRAYGSLPDDIVVAAGVVPHDGRPIPELVIGPFGVAIVHELGRRDRLRQVGQSWEERTSDGWVPSEHPRELVSRDVDRVRHWLTNRDLDYVVRIYGALVTSDASIARSAQCSIIREDQIPAWLASLPRQRSFGPARRSHLLARIRESEGAGPSHRR